MAERTEASQKAYQNKRKVLQIKAAKASPKEKRVIDNQILRLDMEHSQSNPSVMDALDAPLKAVKKVAALKPSDAAVTAERQRTTGMLTSVAAATNDEN